MATAKYRTNAEGRLRRLLLVDLLPFAVMLLLASWLTLWAAQQIDRQREQRLTATEVATLQHF